MTHSVRVATAVTLTLLAVLAGAAHVAADRAHTMVRIYDTGVRDDAVRTAAIGAAAAILDDAGAALELRDCTTSAALACRQSDPSRDLIVRIMPTQVAPTRAARLNSGHVEAYANLENSDFQLGFAVLDPTTRTGAMATVFHDRVDSVARRTGVELSELLGRTLAHEIGHLVLRAPGHSGAGLMRAVWTDAELTMNRREDWLFTPSDRVRLQR
jgi:hypothetical protein